MTNGLCWLDDYPRVLFSAYYPDIIHTRRETLSFGSETMSVKTFGVAFAAFALAASVAGCSKDDDAETEACTTASDSEIDSLFTQWNDALVGGDAAKVAALYDEDAVLLPTLSVTMANTPEQITEYFTNLIKASPDARMEFSEKESQCNLAFNVGTWVINANGADVHARVTWIYEYEDGKWMITHHHSSVDPTPA